MPKQAPYRKLCAAVGANDTTSLAQAIDDYPDAVYHWKPITDAAFYGHVDCARLLLGAGADPNVRSGTGSRHTPLTRLTQHHKTIPKRPSHTTTLELLLERGADPNVSAGPNDFTPFMYAAMAPNMAYVGLLLNHIKRRTVFVNAAMYDIKRLRRQRESLVDATDRLGRTPLHYLAASGLWRERGSERAIACAEYLLAEGVDVDAVQEIPDGGEIFEATALWWTVGWQQNTLVAKCLLKHGADPNKAVFAAVFEGKPEILSLLDRHGANWNLSFEGRTPLLDLVNWNRPAPIPWLLEHGANVGAKDPTGRTALHYAAERGSAKRVFETLLSYGADPGVKSAAGETPRDTAKRAQKRNMREVIDLLS